MYYDDERWSEELELEGFRLAGFSIGDVCENCPLWELLDRETATEQCSNAGSDGVFVTLQDASGRRARIQYAPGYMAEDSEEVSIVTDLAKRGVEACTGPSERKFRVIAPKCRAAHFGFTAA